MEDYSSGTSNSKTGYLNPLCVQKSGIIVYKTVCNKIYKDTFIKKPTLTVSLVICHSFRLTRGITPTRSRLSDL